MAATYTLAATGLAFATSKSMIGVFNGVGSGRIVRVYRVLMLNNGVAAITGGLNTMELRRITTGSGGTPISPVKHDSTNESFPAQIICGTNMSITATDLFRRWIWSTDEASSNVTATIDEFETLVPFNYIWDVGYGETSVEPLVLREGYGLSVQCTGSILTGSCDLFFEMTLASS
jgi:hypothetical protein